MNEMNLFLISILSGVILGFLIAWFVKRSGKTTSADSIKEDFAKDLGILQGSIQGVMKSLENKMKEENDRSIQSLEDTLKKITSIERTLAGTKSRGNAGEALLESYLETSIKLGDVKKDLKIGSKNVEFAWKVNEGKYIPIDAKLPDIFSLVDEYDNSDDIDEQKSIGKKVKDRISKEISNVQKYQNQSNTIDCCILAVPSVVLNMSPELLTIGKDSNVYLSSYKYVVIIAHLLSEQYKRFLSEGDIGSEKIKIKQLNQMLDKIFEKSDSIDKAIKTISNANNDIKVEITKSKRL